MYCPFCGWDLIPYRITHSTHKIAYQCENGACEHSPQFIAIEVLGTLPKGSMRRFHTEPTRKEEL